MRIFTSGLKIQGIQQIIGSSEGRKPGDPAQHEDELFESKPEPLPNNFFVYKDEHMGKAHGIPEADDIPDLEMYINHIVLLPQNGEHMLAARVI